MNEDSMAEALRALVTNSAKKSETGRLRLVFNEIELALASGVSRGDILKTLRTEGLTMTLGSFDSAMHRLRKEHETQQTARPGKSEPMQPMRVHTSETAENRAAAPQGLTPKNNPLTAKPSVTNQGAPAPRRPGEPEKFVWDVDKNETPEW